MAEAPERIWVNYNNWEARRLNKSDIEYVRADIVGQRIAKLEAANEKVRQWVKAYPLKIFPEMTTAEWKIARQALNKVEISLDRISASNMRHVITRVGEILDEALKETQND